MSFCFKKILPRWPGVSRLPVENLPLFQEGAPDGLLWLSHENNWSGIRRNDATGDWLACHRFIRVRDFLDWCQRNNIEPF